jgi:hypothetical protein
VRDITTIFFVIPSLSFYTVDMKTHKMYLLPALALVVLVLLSGCTTLDSLAGDALGSAVSSRMPASSPSGEPEDSPFAASGDYLSVLPPGAAFQIVYAQSAIFTAGGIATDDFNPGEGVRWELDWNGPDGESETVETEQAFLSQDSAGEWWYISLSGEDYRIEYEYFIDPEEVVTELIYRDSDMTESETVAVSIPIDRDNEDGDYESLYDEMVADESGDYTVTRTNESVTVPAGTFDAEKVAVTGTDEETGEEVDATWWFVPDVPGDVVRFLFISEEDGQYQGSLLEYRTDYRRRL